LVQKDYYESLIFALKKINVYEKIKFWKKDMTCLDHEIKKIFNVNKVTSNEDIHKFIQKHLNNDELNLIYEYSFKIKDQKMNENNQNENNLKKKEKIKQIIIEKKNRELPKKEIGDVEFKIEYKMNDVYYLNFMRYEVNFKKYGFAKDNLPFSLDFLIHYVSFKFGISKKLLLGEFRKFELDIYQNYKNHDIDENLFDLKLI
jgi:hypothetical protein